MSKIDPEAQKRADTKRTTGLPTEAAYWATPDCNTSTYSNGKMGPNIREQATSWNANSAAINSPNPAGATDVPTAKATGWPTPRGTDGTKGVPNQAGSKGDLMLPSAAAQWPTPAARDSKGANSAEQHALITGGGRKHMDQLSNFVAHSSHLAQPMPDGPPSCESGPDSPQPSTKRLNPAFGEWLMGWPIGHTIAEPSASSASEMASWRCKLRQRLSYLFAE
jgi:hypothetical protein